jgi:PKD repeat protein
MHRELQTHLGVIIGLFFIVSLSGIPFVNGDQLDSNDLKILINELNINNSQENVPIHSSFNIEPGDKANNLPLGSVIYQSVNGTTRVFDKFGKQLISADDREADLIRTPRGKEPASHVFEVPNGSFIENNNQVIRVFLNGERIFSIVTPEEETSSYIPEAGMNDWIEQSYYESIDNLESFDAYWNVPERPVTSTSTIFLFTGIMPQPQTVPQSGTTLIQPVLEWNNGGSEHPECDGHWCGRAWYITNNGNFFPSTPFVATQNDEIKGMMTWSESQHSWGIAVRDDTHYNLVSVRDNGGGGTNLGTNNLKVACALEGYDVYQNADLPATITFHDMLFKDTNFNPVTFTWKKWYNSDTNSLPDGLYVDILSQSQVELETDKTYTISPTAGSGGYTSPSNLVSPLSGSDYTVTISAYDPPYKIGNVIVDGESLGAITSFEFENIQADHTIVANFLQFFILVPNAGSGGNIFPSSPVSISQGGCQTFEIKPNSGYTIDNVVVSGVSIGAISSYIFTNVSADSTISATFKPLNSPPLADFTASPTYGDSPITVAFTDNSDGEPVGWAWYFGDETFSGAWTNVTGSAAWQDRYGHTSVALPDGSIVLMGGNDGTTALRDVWRSTNNGTTWTNFTTTVSWAKREEHTSVVLPDGSIVLMGGRYSNTFRNDVWRSTNSGFNWTGMNASAGWQGRYGHASVAMQDGSIVLMGGNDGTSALNDVWRSTDNGATWTEINANAGWSARYGHTSVVLPDNSIVLMGGNNGSGALNDVWRSTDNGATWTSVTTSAGWSARYAHSSVTLPDGTILLMGGNSGPGLLNDIWRSKDNGATWKQVTAGAGWSARSLHSSVVLPNGRIVLTGGDDGTTALNDVWRFSSAKSLDKNPPHTYTTPGTYSVTLQVYSPNAFNSTTKARLIHAGMKDFVGEFRNSTHLFFLDYNRNESWDNPAIDRRYDYFGVSGDTPLAGDWDGDGTTEIGTWNKSHHFLLDANGNGELNAPPADLDYNFGSSNDYPIAGDWDGDGKTEIGVFRKSTNNFILDSNGNGILDNTSTDRRINFSAENYVIPVTGDWNDDGKTEVGVFLNSSQDWYLDLDGDKIREEPEEGPFDFGSAGDIPVTGDWNGNGICDIGIFRPTGLGVFHLDYDEDKSWVLENDKSYSLVMGNYPIAGRW